MPSSENNPWNYLEQRFGIAREDMEKYMIVERSGDYWLVSDGFEDLDEEIEFETVGIRLLRRTGRGLKPTTYGLQLMEEEIQKSIVDLEREELLKLLKREDMIPRDIEEEGYMALKYEGKVIGCGMYKDGVVSSRVPKGRGAELAEALE